MTTFSKVLFSYVFSLLHVGCMLAVSFVLFVKGIQIGDTVESNLLYMWLVLGAGIAPAVIAAYEYRSHKADFLYTYGRTAFIILVASVLCYWTLSGQFTNSFRELINQ